MRHHNLFRIILLSFFIFLIFVFFLFLILRQENPAQIDMAQDPVGARRAMIEREYPEFKDFESQDSFAGQSVASLASGDDHYFAYLVHGSGLPIVKGTCFRVDRLGRVFMVGLFPDPLDSFAGYPEVDPRDCSGVRREGELG